MLRPMADDIPPVVVPVAPVPNPIAQDFFAKPTKFLQAVSDPMRWAVLRQLAPGQSKSVVELANALGRYPDTMSRHLTVLRSVGAIIAVPSPDGDTRKQHQSVPERFRRTDEAGKPMIDYGVCVLRFP